MKKTAEELMEGRQLRRMKEEDRFIAQLEKLEAKAGKMIGELVRNGKTIYYVSPVGGKYKEGTEGELIAYLIRNNHI